VNAMLGEYKQMQQKLDILFARKVNKVKALRPAYKKARSVVALADGIRDVRRTIRKVQGYKHHGKRVKVDGHVPALTRKIAGSRISGRKARKSRKALRKSASRKSRKATRRNRRSNRARRARRARRGARRTQRTQRWGHHHRQRFAEAEAEADSEAEEEEESHLSARVAAALQDEEASEEDAAPRFQAVEESEDAEESEESEADAEEESEDESESEAEAEAEEEGEADAEEESSVDRSAAKRELLAMAASALHDKDEGSLLVRLNDAANADADA